jgi:hypothetical protein
LIEFPLLALDSSISGEHVGTSETTNTIIANVTMRVQSLFEGIMSVYFVQIDVKNECCSLSNASFIKEKEAEKLEKANQLVGSSSS